MDYSHTFAISAAGMAAERARVDAAAINLANANTVQDANGVAFRPMRAVAHAAFSTLVDDGLSLAAAGPMVTLEPTSAPPRLVHEPGHPLANDKGFVAYPGVDAASEMVTLMSASRAYEANVAVASIARTLALKALEIGRGS
ncbi:MAG TPA: flagellar basal body rod protein FlgC [Ramlibacter sp.]|nr:flagellar basal body rod protein FlgC [Ramlibacter sp.]